MTALHPWLAAPALCRGSRTAFDACTPMASAWCHPTDLDHLLSDTRYRPRRGWSEVAERWTEAGTFRPAATVYDLASAQRRAREYEHEAAALAAELHRGHHGR